MGYTPPRTVLPRSLRRSDPRREDDLNTSQFANTSSTTTSDFLNTWASPIETNFPDPTPPDTTPSTDAGFSGFGGGDSGGGGATGDF